MTHCLCCDRTNKYCGFHDFLDLVMIVAGQVSLRHQSNKIWKYCCLGGTTKIFALQWSSAKSETQLQELSGKHSGIIWYYLFIYFLIYYLYGKTVPLGYLMVLNLKTLRHKSYHGNNIYIYIYILNDSEIILLIWFIITQLFIQKGNTTKLKFKIL